MTVFTCILTDAEILSSAYNREPIYEGAVSKVKACMIEDDNNPGQKVLDLVQNFDLNVLNLCIVPRYILCYSSQLLV